MKIMEIGRKTGSPAEGNRRFKIQKDDRSRQDRKPNIPFHRTDNRPRTNDRSSPEGQSQIQNSRFKKMADRAFSSGQCGNDKDNRRAQNGMVPVAAELFPGVQHEFGVRLLS